MCNQYGNGWGGYRHHCCHCCCCCYCCCYCCRGCGCRPQIGGYGGGTGLPLGGNQWGGGYVPNTTTVYGAGGLSGAGGGSGEPQG